MSRQDRISRQFYRKPRVLAPLKRPRSPGSHGPAVQHGNSVADGHGLSTSPQAPPFLWSPQLSFLNPLVPFLSLTLFTHFCPLLALDEPLGWLREGDCESKGSSGGKDSSADCHSLSNIPLTLSIHPVLST